MKQNYSSINCCVSEWISVDEQTGSVIFLTYSFIFILNKLFVLQQKIPEWFSFVEQKISVDDILTHSLRVTCFIPVFVQKQSVFEQSGWVNDSVIHLGNLWSHFGNFLMDWFNEWIKGVTDIETFVLFPK